MQGVAIFKKHPLLHCQAGSFKCLLSLACPRQPLEKLSGAFGAGVERADVLGGAALVKDEVLAGTRGITENAGQGETSESAHQESGKWMLKPSGGTTGVMR